MNALMFTWRLCICVSRSGRVVADSAVNRKGGFATLDPVPEFMDVVHVFCCAFLDLRLLQLLWTFLLVIWFH